MNVVLTEQAINKVKVFLQSKEGGKDKGLRIYVEGGGCSGFQYGFKLDDHKDGDHKLAFGDIQVFVDPFSAPYIKESTVDYNESLMNAGFVVTNPNSKTTCGCGLSFSV